MRYVASCSGQTGWKRATNPKITHNERDRNDTCLQKFLLRATKQLTPESAGVRMCCWTSIGTSLARGWLRLRRSRWLARAKLFRRRSFCAGGSRVCLEGGREERREIRKRLDSRIKGFRFQWNYWLHLGACLVVDFSLSLYIIYLSIFPSLWNCY